MNNPFKTLFASKPIWTILVTGFLSSYMLGAHAQSAPPHCAAVTKETCTIAANLKRGINLGNMLEAPNEGDWGLRLDPKYIDLVAQHFSTVRLPVRWTNHAAAGADATLNAFFAARVDKALDALLAKNMYVILDLHHYNQLFGDKLAPKEFEVQPDVLEARLVNIWRQLALRYKDKPNRLIFELLNEPHGNVNSERWNMLSAKLLAAVRESNPNRAVMIGPTYWNHPKDLGKLKLPADKNIIVSIHTYDPFDFTHQGITYLPMKLPKGVTCCSSAQLAQIAAPLELATKWSKENGYPVHLGEFGSYNAADMPSRVAYAHAVREVAEKNGMGWAYWEFASNFGIYSPQSQTWIEPLRAALAD